MAADKLPKPLTTKFKNQSNPHKQTIQSSTKLLSSCACTLRADNNHNTIQNIQHDYLERIVETHYRAELPKSCYES